MNIVLIFTLSVALASAKYTVKYNSNDANALFKDFIKTYNKQYDEAEKAIRYKIFVKNLEKINKYNEISNHTEFGITQFSDLTSEEFIEKHTGFQNGDVKCTIKEEALDLKPVEAPEEFDWRSKGVVSPVKNQYSCGACWAFSATGNVESIHKIKNGKLVQISEQQLIDCDKDSFGCRGGYPAYAINYLMKNGAMGEESYKYEARDGQCRFNKQNVQVKVTGCANVQAAEDKLIEKLVQIGPLSITVDATNVQGYKGGIITGGHCQGQQVNHAVLLVGYGKGKDGTPYWLIKNSWGQNWGEKGYFKVQRGVNCVLIMKMQPVTAVIA